MKGSYAFVLLMGIAFAQAQAPDGRFPWIGAGENAAANPPLVRGGLAAITLVTADETAMRHFLVDGFGMQQRSLPERTAERSATQAALWGLTGIQGWKEIWLESSGDAAAPAVRVLIIPNVTPRTRDAISAVRDGGVSMSFALAKGSGALERLKAAGIDYFSQFQVPLAKPGGGTYVVEEFYFAGPDNLIVPVVVRPPGMPPTAPIDNNTGLGGPAYAGLTVPAADPEIRFYQNVVGLELRRDIVLTEPALLEAAGLPGEAAVRFVQLFAPGTTTGNLTLVDLGDKGERNPVPIQAPNRGLVMWSFLISDVPEAAERVPVSGGRVVHGPATVESPVWGPHRALIVETPGGFRLELIERLPR